LDAVEFYELLIASLVLGPLFVLRWFWPAVWDHLNDDAVLSTGEVPALDESEQLVGRPDLNELYFTPWPKAAELFEQSLRDRFDAVVLAGPGDVSNEHGPPRATGPNDRDDAALVSRLRAAGL
jgi:hypothetical protein